MERAITPCFSSSPSSHLSLAIPFFLPHSIIYLFSLLILHLSNYTSFVPSPLSILFFFHPFISIPFYFSPSVLCPYLFSPSPYFLLITLPLSLFLFLSHPSLVSSHNPSFYHHTTISLSFFSLFSLSTHSYFISLSTYTRFFLGSGHG